MINIIVEQLKEAKTVVFDIETDGLDLFGDNKAIGLALYFPETDNSYYLAWDHGGSHFSTETEEEVKGLRKSTKRYKLVQTEKLYNDHYREVARISNNCNLSDLQPIIDEWGKVGVTYIAHNAMFDLLGLENIGFPVPETVLDTMIAAHSVYSDWNETKFDTIKGRRNGGLALKWLAVDFFRLVDDYQGEAGLDECARDMTEYLRTKGKCQKIDPKEHLWSLPADVVGEYAELDVRLTWLLHERIMEILNKWNTVDLYYTRSSIQLESLYQMHKNGIGFDLERCQEMFEWGEEKLKELEKDLDLYVHENWPEKIKLSKELLLYLNKKDKHEDISKDDLGILFSDDMSLWDDFLYEKDTDTIVDTMMRNLRDDGFEDYMIDNPFELSYMFNPRSPNQVMEAALSFGLEITNTQSDTLEEVAEHPFVERLLEYKSLQTNFTRYIAKWVAANEEVLHPTINITGTATGRTSSSSRKYGNLQNPTQDTGTEVNPRELFLPSKGYKYLVEIDYSALEMVIGAWLAEHVLGYSPKILTRMIVEGEDMHAYTLEHTPIREILMGDMSSEEFCNSLGFYNEDDYDTKAYKLLRFKAKTFNFAVMYGAGSRPIMKLLKINSSEAWDLINAWREAYPSVKNASDHLENLAMTYRDHGASYIKYPLERIGLPFIRRYDLYDLKAWTKDKIEWYPRKKMAYKAFNNTVQGIGGLLVAHSTREVIRAFKDLHLNLTVHDSLLFSANDKELSYIPEIVDIMTDYDFIYPELSVSVEYTDTNWTEMKEYNYE